MYEIGEMNYPGNPQGWVYYEGELYEETINGFDFKFETDEGYWVVTWFEPTTNEWEHLVTFAGSLEGAVDAAKREAKDWDVEDDYVYPVGHA